MKKRHSAAKGRPLIDRIRDRCRVDPATGCWHWKQYTTASGVPSIQISGLAKHPMTVRRLVWVIQIGGIDARRVVTTRCGHVDCVAPEHLRSVRRSDLARSLAKQVLAPMSRRDREAIALKRPIGPNRKLDPQAAERIREAAANGVSSYVLAQQYGASAGQIRKVVRGEAWVALRPAKPATWHP